MITHEWSHPYPHLARHVGHVICGAFYNASTAIREVQRTCSRCPCTSLSLTSDRRLIWSAEMASPKNRLSTQTADHDRSFHTDTKGTVQFNGSFSEPFEIRNGVKQGCVLAPTLFGIFVGMLLKHAFDTTTEIIYLNSYPIRWQALQPRPSQS